MKYYIELTLISNDEMGLYALWSKLYTQIHLGLVEMQDDQGVVPIGVAFPEYAKDRLLGQKLRLFATTEALLAKFDVSKWLAKLTDYVHCSSIRAVPEDRVTGHVHYKRYQPKLTLEQRAKHQAERRNISYDEALAHFKNLKSSDDLYLLPYITLHSLTNKERFPLFIHKTKATVAINQGYGTYGLSAVSTVPEF